MLPDPKNKKTSKVPTTTSMIPRTVMNKMSSINVDQKPSKLDIQCFEPKPMEVEEEEKEDKEAVAVEDVDFLGLKKINEMPDVAPVAGFDLPEINTNNTIIEVDKVYGPVYCPESSESEIYEENETKLILDSNAVRVYTYNYYCY